MIRSLKKRLKGVQRSNSSVSRDSNNGSIHDDSNGSDRQPERATTNPINSVKKQTPKQQQMEAMLASFDACVLAADALGSANEQREQPTLLSARKDAATGLVDCSVLVSPDGDLLLLPQKSEANSADNEDENSLFSALIARGKEDYDSAIFFGNDLQGDKALNGFSAAGWSIPATSHALYQTEASVQQFRTLYHAWESAQTNLATETLRVSGQHNGGTTKQQPKPWRGRKEKSVSADWELIDPRASDFQQTTDRVGPLVAPQSTLQRATRAVEDYHVNAAQRHIQKWAGDSESDSRPGRDMVDSLDKATEQLTKRVLRRQQALEEASRKVRVLEDNLIKLKQTSDRSWEAVYQAEAKVTKKVEQILKDRSREREKQRLAQLREQEQVEQATAGLGTTSEEIWDIVNSVAESMNDGSFEPMDLPTAPIKAPRDKSKTDSTDIDELASAGSSDSLPMVSREAIEQEVGLPELRLAAMRADDEIETSAQDLLQILSKLDTTRRSARTAAETCLVAAGNAQAKCLKAWVELERDMLESRLAELKAVEEAVELVDVRSDLDSYISADKKDKGGSSHLGDDDDGGVASALATLSSHIDGIMGTDAAVRKNSISDAIREADDGTTLASLETKLEKLFEDRENLDSDIDSSVEALCKTALERSSLAAVRRSALCYALNTKRSSNAQIRSRTQFDALCKVFGAILTGCNSEEGGVANAKMCIMLAQTFYVVDDEATPDSKDSSSPNRNTRSRRLYIRSALQDHPIWGKDDFWDEALSQQISEALTQSGVMSNFEKQKVELARKIRKNSEWAQTRKTKWHDLNSTERVEAASQVHAVVFAQLGALAHSMIEFGCGLERSCAFVRRMSIRNQLPSSHRIMLLKHLMSRKDAQE